MGCQISSSRQPTAQSASAPASASASTATATSPSNPHKQANRRAHTMATTAAADIPTVELLYKLGKLTPSSQPLYTPNASHNQKVAVTRGDITRLAVDAIVNAANGSLLGGGGVDGAIHRAAGRGLLQECKTLNGCATGSAKITGAYNLPCKKVIHTVGPVYDELNPAPAQHHLENCYRTSLALAVQHGCRTVAFSAISTGIYGYPSYEAAPIAAEVVRDFLDGEDGDKLDKVIFCTFEMKDVNAYNEALPVFFPPPDQTAAPKQTDDGPTQEQADEADAIAAELPSVPKTDPAQ